MTESTDMLDRESDAKATIQLAIQGDRWAMETLLLSHYDVLEGSIAKQLPKQFKSVVQVEDVLQETFVQAIRSIRQCQATTPEEFSAWLGTLARHRVLDVTRQLRCMKRGGDLRKMRASVSSNMWPGLFGACGSDASPSRSAARHEAVARIQAAITQLPSDQRNAVQRRYIDGKSLEETAVITNRSPAAVRGLLHRAKQRLREIMQSSSRWFDKK